MKLSFLSLTILCSLFPLVGFATPCPLGGTCPSDYRIALGHSDGGSVESGVVSEVPS